MKQILISRVLFFITWTHNYISLLSSWKKKVFNEKEENQIDKWALNLHINSHSITLKVT